MEVMRFGFDGSDWVSHPTEHASVDASGVTQACSAVVQNQRVLPPQDLTGGGPEDGGGSGFVLIAGYLVPVRLAADPERELGAGRAEDRLPRRGASIATKDGPAARGPSAPRAPRDVGECGSACISFNDGGAPSA
jgi:hypothetical protein